VITFEIKNGNTVVGTAEVSDDALAKIKSLKSDYFDQEFASQSVQLPVQLQASGFVGFLFSKEVFRKQTRKVFIDVYKDKTLFTLCPLSGEKMEVDVTTVFS
jgi:hypothetical protein